MSYLNRYVESKIKGALETSGVVVVTGPKFCGKTTTSRLFCKSEYSLDTKAKIQFVQSSPEGILIGSSPRLIDEWQNVPDLWNCARSEVDKRNEKFGQFIFTGSSTPANMNDIYHTGSGRIVTVNMRGMSLFESGNSSGAVSILELFKNPEMKFLYVNERNNMYDIAFFICRGGWPLSILSSKDKALQITENYCSTLFNFENSHNLKFRNKKQSIFKLILKSYARNISTEARRKVLLDDINKHDDRNLSPDTFDDYIQALNDLYIIKDIEAWNPNFRSKTSIISTPTRHFVDTSVATNALGISVNDLINDPKTFGLMFEDFAVNELTIYADYLNGEIRHYRDSDGLECDAVIHLKDGEYALIEIKLGGKELIEQGISNLLALKRKIISNGQKEPKFLMVLIALGDAYVSKEGVFIVPINMLKAD